MIGEVSSVIHSLLSSFWCVYLSHTYALCLQGRQDHRYKKGRNSFLFALFHFMHFLKSYFAFPCLSTIFSLFLYLSSTILSRPSWLLIDVGLTTITQALSHRETSHLWFLLTPAVSQGLDINLKLPQCRSGCNSGSNFSDPVSALTRNSGPLQT